jgi:two-component system response regulator PilR (NtrC family)
MEETVDVRIVSATHKDLAAEVQAGRFRQDLFYRLNVIEIIIPPLRERRVDLPALCAALLSKLTKESGLPAPQLSPHLLAQLNLLPLHGNVRELENLLHRALALHDGSELDFSLNVATQATPEPQEKPATATRDALSASATPTTLATPSSAPAIPDDLQAYLDAQERSILVQVLQETQFNRTAAAARLKLSLRQIRYRIARLNITLPQSDEGGLEEPVDDEQ